MFCPKCGSQNADKTKFCRGCGVELGNLLASAPTAGRQRSGGPDARSLAEKHIEIYSRGISGLMIGVGFVILAALAYALSTRGLAFALFALAFAIFFLSMGVSRLVQAKGLKTLAERDEPAALTSSQTEFIKPLRSVFDTDDLSVTPISVTENTTRHLQLDAEEKSARSPKP